MLTKTIPRVMVIDAPVPTEKELVKLATDSLTQLGYPVLDSLIKDNEKQKKEGLSFTLLTEALRDLEIEVFDNDEVQKYAKQKIDEKRQLEKRIVPLSVCLLFTISSIVCLLLSTTGCPDFAIFFAISLVASIITWFMRSDTTEATLWEWQKVNLKDYKKPVPEFVLRKALQIKERCPNVTFFIYELIKRERQINGDPFLAVCYGNDGYFIEVWDEPKFEAKL